MTAALTGKIFLSEQRGLQQTHWYRSYSTFNYKAYQTEGRQSFGPVYLCNDDTLAGGHAFKMDIRQHTRVLLLPVVGNIKYTDSLGNDFHITPGSLLTIELSAGESYIIANTYENESELVNFIQLWISIDEPETQHPSVLKLDISKNNVLHTQQVSPAINFTIAKFNGRSDAIYNIKNNNAVFGFVIQGAFEMQGRLLHQRDALALWNIHEADMEALSNEAIIVILEVPV